MPTVVAESAWLESHRRLQNDIRLWLQGGAGAIQLVFLFKFYTPASGNRVRGVMELHGLDRAGNDILIQEVVIINLSNFI
jgi:hypothetical protein